MKRLASRAVLAATTAAACGAGLLTAPAAQAGVIAAAGNTPVLAATDFNNNSLGFYQRNDTTMSWGKPEQVARPGTTTSQPSVAQLSPDSHGSGTSWTVQPVTPSGGIVEGSIEQVGQSVAIGADFDFGTGLFWWESASGTGPWIPETVN